MQGRILFNVYTHRLGVSCYTWRSLIDCHLRSPSNSRASTASEKCLGSYMKFSSHERMCQHITRVLIGKHIKFNVLCLLPSIMATDLGLELWNLKELPLNLSDRKSVV